MTRARYSIKPTIAPSVRRGRGSGEPTPHSVPRRVNAPEPLLLDSREVAYLLGIGRTKAFQMMSTGQLPVVRIGRCARVPRSGLDSWILERTSIGLGGELANPGQVAAVLERAAS